MIAVMVDQTYKGQNCWPADQLSKWFHRLFCRTTAFVFKSGEWGESHALKHLLMMILDIWELSYHVITQGSNSESVWNRVFPPEQSTTVQTIKMMLH